MTCVCDGCYLVIVVDLLHVVEVKPTPLAKIGLDAVVVEEGRRADLEKRVERGGGGGGWFVRGVEGCIT